MSTISLFTAINYKRQSSVTENVLSKLSHYFYLGGKTASVIRNNEVELAEGKVPYHIMALKVASYILLFPLTLPLLVIHISLKNYYNFTIIDTSLENVVDIKSDIVTPDSNSEFVKQEIQKPFADIDQEKQNHKIDSIQTEIIQKVENVKTSVLEKEPFYPFRLKISEKEFSISSKEEMHKKAQELGQQVLDEHVRLRIDIPSRYMERIQALQFIKKLKSIVDTIPTRFDDLFYIVPKKTLENKENFVLRKYNNGVIEEVDNEEKDTWIDWQGRRIYPNGVIETGEFIDFNWYSGISVNNDEVRYRRPDALENSFISRPDRNLMYAEIEGEKRLIVLRKKPNSHDYVQVKEEIIPTLVEILKSDYVNKDLLQEILLTSINFEDFIQLLFKTNEIFSITSESLEILLKIIQDKALKLDWQQQHPETNKNLLNYHSKNENIVQTLLAIDPTLTEEAQRILIEHFQKKLYYYSGYDKDPKKIAEELFKNIPESLSLGNVVDFIFTCNFYQILPLLEALLIAHPSFVLSPCDRVRMAIVKDKEQKLNNASLLEMLKQYKLDNNKENLKACCDLAYHLNHPYIYQVSKTVVLTHDYTLNFLWVNLNPQDRTKDVAQNIFGEGLDLSENAECIKDPEKLRAFEENEKLMKGEELENWNKIKKSFTYRISKWADVNPGAQINLWYDSALVTQKAFQNTFEMMQSISKSRGVDLKLRDIRQLPNIKGEIEHSMHPGTQIYYRVDMLKALIGDYMMSSSEENAKFCVVTDVDVKSMPPEETFDQRTQDYLSTNGYVFNKVSCAGDFENSFFIFNKDNKELQKVHYKYVIKAIVDKISLFRDYPRDAYISSSEILGAQVVFSQYSKFRAGMKEKDKKFFNPRKVVKCPRSQFNFGGNFSKSDYQSETFRFIEKSNVPYTRNGRNTHKWGYEEQITELVDWKSEPLTVQ